MITYSKRNKVLFISILFAMLLIGCASDKDTSHYAQTIFRAEEMPEITFMCFTDYEEVADEGDVVYEIIFYDNKGNIYFSDDPGVCFSEYKEMTKAFKEGKYDNKMSLIGTCDVNELFKNYRKLCKISKMDNYKLIYPEEQITDPGVNIYWYGIYYNRTKEIEILKLHDRNTDGDHDANDERATQIYEWFEENISKDVE